MPSKLGPHFQTTGSIQKWIQAGTRAFKFASGQGPASQLPANVLAVGRRDQNAPTDWKALKNQGHSPKVVADRRFNFHKAGYELDSRIDVWEDDNEVVPDNEDEAKWYAEYSIFMMENFESIGKKRANFSFAVGTPDLGSPERDKIWLALLPAVRHAHEHGHYIALHEYMAAEKDLGVGKNNRSGHWFGRIDSASNPVEAYPYGWGVLRYRYIYDNIFRPAGLGNVPLLITEAGCDTISFTPPEMSKGPWTNHISYWNSKGIQDTEAHYANMLRWYDQKLQEDPYVKGAFIFTVGFEGQWKPFEIANTAVEQHILSHIRAGGGDTTPIETPHTTRSTNIVEPTPTGARTGPTIWWNFRKGPGSGYSIIYSVEPGTPVEILGKENGFYHVKIGEDKGYIWAEGIVFDSQRPIIQPAPSTTNRRSGRGDGPAIGTGSVVHVLPFIRGTHRQQFDKEYLWTNGVSGTQTTQVWHIDDKNWLYVKGENGEYERLGVRRFRDEDWIFRFEDTSEAPDRFYAHFRSNGGEIGAPWVPCNMVVGKVYETRKFVQHFRKSDSAKLNSNDVVDKLRLQQAPQAKNYPKSGQSVRKVITLEWSGGEEYDFANGNIAFRDEKRDFWFMNWLDGRPDKTFIKPNNIDLGW